jgi:uncharacterized membrane protein (DUF4010 family)
MDLAPPDLFYRFGVALVIGLLVGLQREYAFQKQSSTEATELLAGARTFPLIGLLGCAAALLADQFDAPAIVGGVALALGALLVVGHFLRGRSLDAGITTEVAALLTFVVGGLCYEGALRIASALGVATAVLLTLKVQTHALAREIDREDVFATLKFAVITVIILPLLPQTGYGPPPFDVLVPYDVWLMVVLISGISFLGYVLIQVVGPRRGVGLTGILGGIASSTAVTLTFAQRSRDVTGFSAPFALAIVLAWTLMFIRVLAEVAAINPPLLRTVWAPVLGTMAAGVGYAVYLYVQPGPSDHEEEASFTNPFRLAPAVTFGLLYAVILVAANGAQSYFGTAGVYVSSVVSGLADVDAITLSMAQLSGPEGDISHQTAARAILLGAAANTLFKGAIVFATGSQSLRRALAPGVAVILVAAGIAVALI